MELILRVLEIFFCATGMLLWFGMVVGYAYRISQRHQEENWRIRMRRDFERRARRHHKK